MIKRSHKMLLALAFVFMAPGILAIIFYMHPEWLHGLPTNKGQFITPPRKVAFLSPGESSDWHILLWCKQGCNDSCLKQVDELARMRLALGRRLYQVDLWLLEPKEMPSCTSEVQAALQAQDVKIQPLTIDDGAALNSPLFLADKKGYLVLEYTNDSAVKDIYTDLKRLLSSGEQS